MKKIFCVLSLILSITATAQIETGTAISSHSEMTPAQRVMQKTPAIEHNQPLLIHTQTKQFYKRKNYLWKGALIGGSIGLFTGVVGGFASGDDPETQWFAYTAGQKAFAYGLLGLLGGAVVGGLIGVFSKEKEKTGDAVIIN